MATWICSDCTEISECVAACQQCRCEVCGSIGTMLPQDVYARLHERAFGDSSEEARPGARLNREVQQLVFARSLKVERALLRQWCEHCNHGGNEECECKDHRNHDERKGWCCLCAAETDIELRRFEREYMRDGKLTDSIHRPVSDEEREQQRQDLLDAGRGR